MTRLFGRARLYASIACKSSLHPALPAGFQDTGAYFLPYSFPPCSHLPANSNVFSKNLHTTSHKRKAAPKLKEPLVDSSDDIDCSKPADYNPSTHDSQESRSPPTEKILRIVDEIAHLTMIDAADLAHLLKRKLGLPDSAMPYYGGAVAIGVSAAGQGSPSPANQEEKKPEKTNFDVKLEKYEAASKIKIIKEVRTFTTLGLKEAKELVEKLPAILKAGVAKEEAEKILEKLKAVGATCILE